MRAFPMLLGGAWVLSMCGVVIPPLLGLLQLDSIGAMREKKNASFAVMRGRIRKARSLQDHSCTPFQLLYGELFTFLLRLIPPSYCL